MEGADSGITGGVTVVAVSVRVRLNLHRGCDVEPATESELQVLSLRKTLVPHLDSAPSRGGESIALVDLLKVGLLSGIPVAVATGLLFMLRYRTNPILKTIKLPLSKGGTWAAMWGFAVLAALILGVIGAWVYSYVGAAWAWGPTQYLLLGIGLAAVLSVLSFLPLYGGKKMQGALDISVLNFIVGVGLGMLVPYFAA